MTNHDETPDEARARRVAYQKEYRRQNAEYFKEKRRVQYRAGVEKYGSQYHTKTRKYFVDNPLQKIEIVKKNVVVSFD
jgi:hypothetical protein